MTSATEAVTADEGTSREDRAQRGSSWQEPGWNPPQRPVDPPATARHCGTRASSASRTSLRR